LAPFSQLKIKLYFRSDYGYHKSEEQKKYFPEIENVILLDANYSHIKGDGGVNFQVNSIVTGLDKEEEELKLTITTNGAITPKKALLEALEAVNEINDNIKNLLK
jgi:DNA-directed RNA polymerase alpha subunit